MSDRDSRFPPNKKYFGAGINASKVVQEKNDIPLAGSVRTPIILAKPDRDRDSERVKERAGDAPSQTIAATTGSERTPAISILRTRDNENRAVSPSNRFPSTTKKDSDGQPPVYQLVAKHAGSDNTNPLAPPLEMKSSVKLLDDLLQFSEVSLEYLLDQSEFLVIGCVGLQGVGKSTIMSLLAGNDLGDINKTPLIFSPESFEQQEAAAHCTSGIDLYVTSNRVIFLDTRPVLSASVMDCLINLEAKKFLTPEFCSTENAMEIQSLQIAAFMLSVCHVVLVVQDWFFDPNLIRFLQSAEMLKPSTPTTTQDEEIIEYSPHIMFVQNKAQTSDFSQNQVKLMQDVYCRSFAQSKLKIQSGLGLAVGGVVSTLSPVTCGDPVNLFLLADIEESIDNGHYKGHPGMRELVQSLQEQLLGVPRYPLTHSVLTEKNWLHYAAKVWEAISKKSSFFMEYSRLLP